MAATTWLIWPVLTNAVRVWSTEEELGFGFLLGPVAVGLLWWQRAAVRASLGRGARGWVGLVLLSVCAYLVSERLLARSPAAAAAGLLVWAECTALWGWRTGRLLAFPIGLVTFGLALQQTVIAPVAFALQQLTADNAAHVSHVLGLPIVQEGLILNGGSYSFVVAEACSGMNSLLSLLALASLVIYVAAGQPWAKLGVLLSVPLLVIVANTARVVSVLLVASGFGQDAALGFFHGLSSLVLFGLALAGLLAVCRLLGCQTPAAAPSY